MAFKLIWYCCHVICTNKMVEGKLPQRIYNVLEKSYETFYHVVFLELCKFHGSTPIGYIYGRGIKTPIFPTFTSNISFCCYFEVFFFPFSFIIVILASNSIYSLFIAAILIDKQIDFFSDKIRRKNVKCLTTFSSVNGTHSWIKLRNC